jgi:hypothetical protein
MKYADTGRVLMKDSIVVILLPEGPLPSWGVLAAGLTLELTWRRVKRRARQSRSRY